ncbi:MAG: hypothetical protein RLY95_1752 [Pseudomonadota bacterium]|jgi:hypothetical protein
MMTQIISNTPKWVFVLFFVLLTFGISQMRTQIKSRNRVLILPIVLLILSIAGVTSAFGISFMPIAAWTVGYIALAVFIKKGLATAGSSYDSATRKITVTGSPIPLILMMSIFFLKYFVGASMAMKVNFTNDAAFPIVVSLLYGTFSGAFAVVRYDY